MTLPLILQTTEVWLALWLVLIGASHAVDLCEEWKEQTKGGGK